MFPIIFLAFPSFWNLNLLVLSKISPRHLYQIILSLYISTLARSSTSLSNSLTHSRTHSPNFPHSTQSLLPPICTRPSYTLTRKKGSRTFPTTQFKNAAPTTRQRQWGVGRHVRVLIAHLIMPYFVVWCVCMPESKSLLVM